MKSFTSHLNNLPAKTLFVLAMILSVSATITAATSTDRPFGDVKILVFVDAKEFPLVRPNVQ